MLLVHNHNARCSIPHILSPTETNFYGEAFQMLSQTEGTLRDPIDVGPFTDRGHYRMGMPDDAVDLYGLLHLSSKVISGGHSKMDHLVFSFTSCLRFVGKFLLSEVPNLETCAACCHLAVM